MGRQPRQPRGWLEAAVQESGQRKEEGQKHGEAGWSQVLQKDINREQCRPVPSHGLPDDVYEAEGGSSLRGDTPLSFFLEADLPEPVIQREVSTEGESDFFQHRSVVWKEPGEPAAARVDPREGLGQGQEVVDLPEAEEPAMESVAEILGHAIDVSMQEMEERSVYYREEELPVLELEEPPNEWEGGVQSWRQGCGGGQRTGMSGPNRNCGTEDGGVPQGCDS